MKKLAVTEATSVTTGLVRGLGQLDATMIVVGILIGSGIFIVSAESSRLVGAPFEEATCNAFLHWNKTYPERKS